MLDPTLRAIMEHKRPRDRGPRGCRSLPRPDGLDRTQHGTLVLERPDGSEPGKAAALKRGPALRVSILEWDAVVFVDADSVVEPGFFDACEQVLGTGASVAQARSEAERRSGALGASVAISPSAASPWRAARDVMRRLGPPQGIGNGPPARARRHPRVPGTGRVGGRPAQPRAVHPGIPASSRRSRPAALCSCRVDEGRGDAGAAVRVGPARHGRAGTCRACCARAASRARTRPCTCARHRSRCRSCCSWSRARRAARRFVRRRPGGRGSAGALAVDVVIALREARVGREGWLALLLAPAYLLWKGWIQLRAIFGFRRAQQPFEPTPRA